MHGYVVEEDLTLVGKGNTVLTQTSSRWLDLEAYQDVVVWLYTHELNVASGTLQIGYQTSTLEQDHSFVTMIGPLVTNPVTPVVGSTQVTAMLKDYMTVPFARWFRWQLIPASTSGAWDITFSLRLSANCLAPRHRRPR